MVLHGRHDDGYELTKDIGISTFFCDYYRNKLTENVAWNTKSSREKLRASNVYSYMKLQLNAEQREYLGKAQPDKAQFGSDWTLWNQTIRKIGLDVTNATMSALLEAERKWMPQAGKEKSSKGAKLTQTIPAIERRISALKTAMARSKIAERNQCITDFTTRATCEDTEPRGSQEGDDDEILSPFLADIQDTCSSAEVVSVTAGILLPCKKRKSPATLSQNSSSPADSVSHVGGVSISAKKKKSAAIRQHGVQSFFKKATV